MIALCGVLLVLYLIIRWLEVHPGAASGLVVLLVLGCGGAIWAIRARMNARRRREAELTASIESTNGLTGPQFEQWVAMLMRRTGFTQVQVCGGAGDLGADVIAVTPTGCRVVVQCKCYDPGRTVGSPDVQKLAGTARAIHGADVAVIVTTARFTRSAQTTADQLGIVLVDRRQLAWWAAYGSIPAEVCTT